MFSRFVQLFILGQFFFTLFAQNSSSLSPQPNQELFTVHVPFCFHPVAGASSYELQWRVLSGNRKSNNWLKEKLNAPGIILKKGFAFGDSVEWSYKAINQAGRILFTSEIFRFSIAHLPPQLNEFRLRVTKTRSDEAIFFIDNTNAAWNRNGELVWFLKSNSENNRIMDLRMNPNGLISLISVAAPNGKALLLTPTLDTVFDAHKAAGNHPLFPYLTFHHHFEWLSDESLLLVADIKPSIDFKDLNMGTGIVKKFPQVVLNLTKSGKINWMWEADKYLSFEDNGCYGHINSVAYNWQSDELLISMKDLSRILLTQPRKNSVVFSLNGINERSDKKLVAMSSHRASVNHAQPNAVPGRLQNFGEATQPPPRNRTIPKPGSLEVQGILGPFSGQHSVQFSSSGNVLMFNNNSYNPNSKFSTLLELKRPVKAEDDSEVVWQHVLQFQDSLPKKAMGRGSVQLCPGGELMTYMGQISRILETDSSHNLLWMGYLEHMSDTLRNWQNSPGYKAFRASSLYPAFYTAEILNSNGESPGKIIRISNLGSESDAYLIKDNKGKILKKIEVLAESQQMVPVLETWPKKLEIHSSLNKSAVRIIDL